MDDTADQRKFLHDIANPLAVAQGNLRIALDKIKKDAALADDDPRVIRLQKALSACDEMNHLLIERRNHLKSKVS